MKRLAVLLVAVAALWPVAASAAAPTGTGTIAVASSSDLTVGGHVEFDVTVSDVPRNKTAYVEVKCYDVPRTTLIYDAEAAVGSSFALTTSGECYGLLRSRGTSIKSIETLAEVAFVVP